jgi:putative hydrolase of the HAD superfamily
MRFRAVVFDLFGTLVYNSTPLEGEAVFARMGVVLSVPARELIRMWSLTSNDRMTGVFPDYRACIAHICKELGLSPGEAEVSAAAAIRLEMTSGELSRPQAGAASVLAQLKSLGYRTALISDISLEASRIFMASPLAALIDVSVFSCMERTSKQESPIFERAIERIGVTAGTCLYVADGSGRELDNAAAVGMTTVLLRIPGCYGENPLHMRAESWQGSLIYSLESLLDLLD